MRPFVAGGALAIAVVFVLITTSGVIRKISNNDVVTYMTQRSVRRDLEAVRLQGAWLMYYPNSGGEHITQFIQLMTGKATATNYGDVIQNPDGTLTKNTWGSHAVWDDHPNGPYKYSKNPLPNIYIPVATKCAGLCFECHPQYYMLSQFVFSKLCHSGVKYNPYGKGHTEKVTYDRRLIAKGVQLVRPPLDNIVARFIHYRKMKKALGDEVWLDRFSETPDGFHMWCDDVASRFREEENILWPKDVWAASYGVPCRQEFYRYIQWHNYAHEITRETAMDIPLAVVHTRDLQENFLYEMDSLIWYFRMNMTQPLTEFHALDLNIPSYPEYFTADERVRIACFLKAMATDDTIDRLGRYMTECPN